VNDGHGWANWRSRSREALVFLFGSTDRNAPSLQMNDEGNEESVHRSRLIAPVALNGSGVPGARCFPSAGYDNGYRKVPGLPMRGPSTIPLC
jgi:hypothetical protein